MTFYYLFWPSMTLIFDSIRYFLSFTLSLEKCFNSRYIQVMKKDIMRSYLATMMKNVWSSRIYYPSSAKQEKWQLILHPLESNNIFLLNFKTKLSRLCIQLSQAQRVKCVDSRSYSIQRVNAFSIMPLKVIGDYGGCNWVREVFELCGGCRGWPLVGTLCEHSALWFH